MQREPGNEEHEEHYEVLQRTDKNYYNSYYP